MRQGEFGKKDGFSLLELLVAVAVLAVSLLGLAQLLGVAIQQNEFSIYNTSAIELARGKLEELKAAYNWELATGGTSADLTDGNHGPEQISLESDDTFHGDRILTVTWSVNRVGNRKDVVISVNPDGMSDPLAQSPKTRKTVVMTTSFSP